MELRIAGITRESVVDGPGLRTVIFTQGCPHHCPGCHNPETHDPNGGRIMDVTEILAIVETAKLIRGVTFSGGEPFMQPGPLSYLAEMVKERGLNVVTYTGYVFEQLQEMGKKDAAVMDLLLYTDILIDGPYRKEQRDLRLAFRGSKNQRIIDLPKTFAKGNIVFWEDPFLQSFS